MPSCAPVVLMLAALKHRFIGLLLGCVAHGLLRSIERDRIEVWMALLASGGGLDAIDRRDPRSFGGVDAWREEFSIPMQGQEISCLSRGTMSS